MITLVPSRNRKELLTRFLQSAVDANTTTDGIILIDEEDWERTKYDEIAGKPGSYRFEVTKGKTMSDKIREIWPKIKDYKSVCLLNDDHFIVTKDWDKKVQEKITGYNFVSTGDNWRSPQKASGATVWSMDLLNAVDWPIYPPGMIHLFIDDLWEYLGRTTGCWNIDHSVIIEHHHPLSGRNPVDQTFVDTYGGTNPQAFPSSGIWQNDERIYLDIRKNQGLELINKIRKLMGLCILGGK